MDKTESHNAGYIKALAFRLVMQKHRRRGSQTAECPVESQIPNSSPGRRIRKGRGDHGGQSLGKSAKHHHCPLIICTASSKPLASSTSHQPQYKYPKSPAGNCALPHTSIIIITLFSLHSRASQRSAQHLALLAAHAIFQTRYSTRLLPSARPGPAHGPGDSTPARTPCTPYWGTELADTKHSISALRRI